jgi:hypothetical protein
MVVITPKRFPHIVRSCLRRFVRISALFVYAGLMAIVRPCVAEPAHINEGELARTHTEISFSAAALGPVSKVWHIVSHLDPARHTRFSVVDIDNQHVLRVESDNANAALVHDFPEPIVATSMAWRWRVERANTRYNLSQKNSDDAPLRVCVAVVIDENKLSASTKLKLSMARLVAHEPLPAATLCYLAGDFTQSENELLPNAFTDRLQMLVLRSSSKQFGQWWLESRSLEDDIRKAFGAELPYGPVKISSVIVVADTDNTHSFSLGLVGDIVFKKKLGK